MPSPIPKPVASLYVHVPFCARKCEYCAFYSAPPQGDDVERFVAALMREMELVAADLRPRTIYFGGGTPSLLGIGAWEKLFEAMARLRWLGAAEWTIEANPASLSLDLLRLFQRYGVNRISLGVQAFQENLLRRLGRRHSRAQVFQSFEQLRQAGFENLNVDLMFAIPGQTLADWRATLAEATALGAEHLSAYEVTYEEDTALYDQLHAGRFEVEEDLACAMYEEFVGCAQGHGYQQYEVSNFARLRPGEAGDIPAGACQHNVNYWRGGDFYGLGPGATSYVRGMRARNRPDTRWYCGQLEQGRRPWEATETLSPLRRAGELAAFGLRLTAGWPFALFQQTTGFDLRQEWAQDMQRLIQCGHGRRDDQRFQLTPLGLRFADAAAELFLR